MKKSKIAVLVLSLGLLMGGVTSVQGNFNKNRDIKKLGETEKAALSAESTKAQLSYSYTSTSGNFKKVTTNLTDWSGTYVIGYEASSTEVYLLNGMLTKLDAANNYISKSLNSGVISGSVASSYAFTISAVTGGYSIQSASGYYIGQTTDANELKSSTTKSYTNTIRFGAKGELDIVSGGAYLRFNPTSGQMRFRYYKSASYTGQKAICLYKLENSYSFSNMKLNFGSFIHKDKFTALTSAESKVTSYGVAIAKHSSLASTETVSSALSAKKTYVKAFEKAYDTKTFAYTDETGTLDEGDYVAFSADVVFGDKTAKYVDVYDAVAYVVVDGNYVFLQERSCSVSSLADEYIASSEFTTFSASIQASLQALGALND